jgi:hypothetical protein
LALYIRLISPGWPPIGPPARFVGMEQDPAFGCRKCDCKRGTPLTTFLDGVDPKGHAGGLRAWKITSTDSTVMLNATDRGEFGIASPIGRQGWAVATFSGALPKGLKLRNTS